jgi:hypothetical protein
MTLGQLWAPALPALVPAALLAWLADGATDYARIELSRAPGTSATRALGRALRFIGTRWPPLVHLLLYYLFFAAVSLLYVAITLERPMLGATGAVSLLFIRQGVAMLRFAAAFTLTAGQVEIAYCGR